MRVAEEDQARVPEKRLLGHGLAVLRHESEGAADAVASRSARMGTEGLDGDEADQGETDEDAGQ